MAVWLSSLLWLEDGRWRKLRSGGAPTDSLEVLLDALSRRVLLLSLPAHTPDTTPQPPMEADMQPLPHEQVHFSSMAPHSQVCSLYIPTAVTRRAGIAAFSCLKPDRNSL